MDKLNKVQIDKLIKFKYILFTICIIFLNFYLTIISLYLSKGIYGWNVFYAYFKQPLIIVLNFIPIFLFCAMLLLITNRLGISFIVTMFLVYVQGFINYYMLVLRNDSLLFEDLQYILEAKKIIVNYQLNITYGMWIIVFISVILGGVCILKLKNLHINWKYRSVCLVFLLILSGILMENVYFNPNLYNSTGDYNTVNYWSATDRYVAHGNIYSFLNSISYGKVEAPEGYDLKEMQQIESQVEYSDIDENKKVNVISIMFEAFNDFSKFKEIEFNEDVYKYLHELQEGSYSGELVTNIFAGGTIDTERTFISGYIHLPNFRKETNTYASYFAEQGYTVEGSHPGYNWFYNRINVNANMGFQKFYFNEGRYENFVSEGIARDDILLPDIIELFEENKKSGKPYFNFSVTYQNHGPYGNWQSREIGLVKWKDEYNESDYNILNNYLIGISSTLVEIEKMVNYFKREEEPVVLILFGDHNPWLGDGNSVYNMLGINLDTGTEEGFYNYYSTPYIIWANDTAKEILGNQFMGEGPTIGPYFLMNEFMNMANYDGNQYLKISNQVYKEYGLQAIRDTFYQVNNEVVTTLPVDVNNGYEDFMKFEYYWKNK